MDGANTVKLLQVDFSTTRDLRDCRASFLGNSFKKKREKSKRRGARRKSGRVAAWDSPEINHKRFLSVDQFKPEINDTLRYRSSYKVPEEEPEPNTIGHTMPEVGSVPLTGNMDTTVGSVAATHVACKSWLCSGFFFFQNVCGNE